MSFGLFASFFGLMNSGFGKRPKLILAQILPERLTTFFTLSDVVALIDGVI